jgi:hypothetical protein
LTWTLFENWFTKYFCSAVNSYCTANQLPNKALLILDNAPAHPTCLDELSSNVKVVFLPPNTTSILQSMDHGMIATFKAYYIRETFSQAVKITNLNEGAPILKEFWRSYDVR